LRGAKTRRRRSPSSIPSTSKAIVYETAKQGFIPGIGDDVDDDDGDSVKEEKEMYGKEEPSEP